MAEDTEPQKGGGWMSSFGAGADSYFPGLPTKVEKLMFGMFSTMQKGTVSVNTASNIHWNDVLSYTSDGSIVRFKGMDFFNDMANSSISKGRTGKMKYNICCCIHCCHTWEIGVGLPVTTLKFRSTDGAHSIVVEHAGGPDFLAGKRGCCAGATPFYPLCCSQTCCKSCFKEGDADFTKLKPEIFTVKFDDKVVATVEVQPGLKEGSTAEAPVFSRESIGKDTSGKTLFQMNKVFIPEHSNVDPFGALKCCAISCCLPCCGCCKPCCCPVCMPFGAAIRCPRCACPKCSCGPCTTCCNASCTMCGDCCNYACTCGPCCAVCGCIGACCHACSEASKKPCCKCGIEVDLEVGADEQKMALPQSSKHKVHRVVYALPTMFAGKDLFGYLTFTQTENSNQSNRTTLAVDPAKWKPEDAPEEVLAVLPLIMDLALATDGNGRTSWTFASRQWQTLFEPSDVVNYWPKGERLQTAMTNFGEHDFINPKQGCTKPKQNHMDASKKSS